MFADRVACKSRLRGVSHMVLAARWVIPSRSHDPNVSLTSAPVSACRANSLQAWRCPLVEN
eukprot:2249449-Alexandrium_andersonii.AAC.1